MKESKKIISQEPSKKSWVLTIRYWPVNYSLIKKNVEVFKNVKTLEAAKKIVARRSNIKRATYKDMVIK